MLHRFLLNHLFACLTSKKEVVMCDALLCYDVLWLCSPESLHEFFERLQRLYSIGIHEDWTCASCGLFNVPIPKEGGDGAGGSGYECFILKKF